MIRYCLLTMLLGCAAARSQEIRFTPFYPHRVIDGSRGHGTYNNPQHKLWGEPYQWPLKTFPNNWRLGLKDMGSSAGCVYVPGETVTIRLSGLGAPVARVTCTNVIDRSTLPVEADADGAYKIKIPPQTEPAPLLKVYRVRAFAGKKEIASRGFIVTRPWSGMTVHPDPKGVVGSNGRTFHEWSGGISNPPTRMCLFFGDHTYSDDMYPLRERPWSDIGAHGLAEFYSGATPRMENWKTLCGDYVYRVPRGKNKGAEKPCYSSEAYRDPTLEWHPWWTYYSRGVSKWNGEWQWGPWAQMSVENHYPGGGDKRKRYEICYSDVKKYCAAYPNGLLYWQWHWGGLLRLHKHMVKYQGGKPVSFGCSDGWAANSLPFAMSRWLRYHQEVGMIPLYYRRCKAAGQSTAWAKDYPSFGAFMAAQMKDTLAGNNKLNDLCIRFGRMDLDTKGFALLSRATNQSFAEVSGEETRCFTRHFSALDFAVCSMLYRDFRPVNRDFFQDIITWADSGGDYSHRAVGRGSKYYNATREYRGLGLTGVLTCALFPECRYGAGYRAGYCMTPGAAKWNRAVKVAKPQGGQARRTRGYLRQHDDGTSYRRFDLAERVPMYINHEGRFVGRMTANMPAWEPSLNPVWNEQIWLGAQVLEIPDRKKPLGGVIVFDSNNEADRKENREFLTDGRNFYGMVTGLMDELGIWTFTNPDMEKHIPDDLVRVYLQRKDGGDGAFLMATLGEQTVRVPYTGEEMHDPQHPGVQDFVKQVRAMVPGGWPVQTTGGFVATAWESSHGGTFVYVENPMDRRNGAAPEPPPAGYEDKAEWSVLHTIIAKRPGIVHVDRKGVISIRIDGLEGAPPVIDLCGDRPDPHRLPERDVRYKDGYVKIRLHWQHGDGRLFWIAHDRK